MLQTKTNLKEEIKHRLSLIEKAMLVLDKNDFEYIILCNEHSQNSEFLSLIEIFENRIGYKKFEASKYTPILDYKTKLPLKIGDKVENNNRQCGVLKFDECFNKYVIKTDTGGHITSTVYVKIHELYDYKIDVTKVECRPRPNKKKW
jgi:hypothetical protein